MIVLVPDRYLRFTGRINMHAPSIGVICISMESTHMELSWVILHVKFVEVLSEIFDNENYKNVLFQICSSGNN